MPRPSVIRHHPQRVEIEKLLGTSSVAEVARRFGLSESATRRWRDRMALTEVDDDGPALAPGMLAGQILEIVRSLSAVRARADALGNDATAIRAATAELAAVGVLLDRLGIESEDALNAVVEAEALAKALSYCLSREDPHVTRRILDRLTQTHAPEGIRAGFESLLARAERNLETTERKEQ